MALVDDVKAAYEKRHLQWMKDHGIEDSGVWWPDEPPPPTRKRLFDIFGYTVHLVVDAPPKKPEQSVSYCHQCHACLNSSIQPVCMRCGRIVCSCGACGCGEQL